MDKSSSNNDDPWGISQVSSNQGLSQDEINAEKARLLKEAFNTLVEERKKLELEMQKEEEERQKKQ